MPFKESCIKRCLCKPKLSSDAWCKAASHVCFGQVDIKTPTIECASQKNSSGVMALLGRVFLPLCLVGSSVCTSDLPWQLIMTKGFLEASAGSLRSVLREYAAVPCGFPPMPRGMIRPTLQGPVRPIPRSMIRPAIEKPTPVKRAVEDRDLLQLRLRYVQQLLQGKCFINPRSV